MVGYDISKVIDLENRVGFTFPIEDINSGVLELNGKKHDVIAVICDSLLSADKIEKLNGNRQVVKVGDGHHRYTPERIQSVIYIKA